MHTDGERKQNNEGQNDAFTQNPSRCGSIILPSIILLQERE
jgi:hypothetical protein